MNLDVLPLSVVFWLTGVLVVIFRDRLTRFSDRFEGRSRTEDEVRRHGYWAFVGLLVCLGLGVGVLFI